MSKKVEKVTGKKAVKAEKQSAKSAKRSRQPQKNEESARRQWIEEAAYHKAAARGFSPGFEEQDWLEAEKEYQTAATGKAKVEKPSKTSQ